MNKLLATFIACCSGLVLTCAAQAQSNADDSSRRSLSEASSRGRRAVEAATDDDDDRGRYSDDRDGRDGHGRDGHGHGRYSDDHGRRSGDLQWGLGFSTLTVSPGISGWLQFSELDSVQAVFGVSRTHEATDLSAGGFYRHTLFGDADEGFHVGGGAEVGVIDDHWYIGLSPLFGFHFTWPNVHQVFFSVDGGARISFNEDWANFQLEPFGGALLAANIHWLF